MLSLVLVVLVANVLAATGRVVLGPSSRDRLLGVVLTGTTGSAALLVASAATGSAALRDTALVVVALATVVVVAQVTSERALRAGVPRTGRRGQSAAGGPPA